ncbi:hypothetical protein KSP40_PGU021422 [Platanthera guangdongensis]|uniref:Glutamate-rich WD repeat-containing protein 1 n=1 Tax=Platanthera guangdongensis TaxID=2320717 RepID=A0ABR2MDJ8_9ASPA
MRCILRAKHQSMLVLYASIFFTLQAEQASWNYIGIFKVSNISGKKRDLVPSGDEDIDMDSESNSDDEDSESEAQCSQGGNSINCVAPVFKFDGHKDEGFALDWSPVVPGRLISGDCDRCIHLWEPSSDSWIVDKNPFVGHKASVEDLQWSPTEADVFASCSVDGSISIWDTRKGRSPVTSLKAHTTDVNVISWNRLASCMIASGSDDGTLSIWDLRLIKVHILS